MENQEEQAKLFKTLMHPVRLEILELLRTGEQCVCHMEAYMDQRQAYISQQLMILREAGLVQDRRDGWNIFYRVVEPRIYAVIDAAGLITGAPTGSGLTDFYAVKNQVSCDCPKCHHETEKSMSQQKLETIESL